MTSTGRLGRVTLQATPNPGAAMRRIPLASAFVAVLSLSPLAAQAGTLGLAERAACHRAVEAVYWAHRTWPDGNSAAKPALDQVLPAAALQRRAEDALAMSRALEERWGRPVTGAMLQREVERMAASTRRPEMLETLFAALRHDSRLVAECLARPVLAERLLRTRYEDDEAIHAAVERRARKELAAVANAGQLAARADRYGEVEWTTAVAEGQDGRVSLDPTAWSDTLSSLAQKLGRPVTTAPEALPAGLVGPLQEDGERFYALGVISARPEAVRVGIAEWPKEPFATWWERERGAYLTATADTTVDEFRLPRPASGPVCNEDTWQPLPNRPPALDGHRAVWTGAEMIVWGGTPSFVVGGRYDPAIDNWRPIAVEREPQKRTSHTMVWTGTEMIVWGGWGFLTSENTLNTGGRYNPTIDTWTATSTAAAPVPRTLHAAVWTGSSMIVWGGCDTFGCGNALATGGRYDPASDTWTPTSTAGAPTARWLHTAVWTGSLMVVWSGCDSFSCANPTPTGGRYDPASDTWTPTSIAGAPSGRRLHTAVWSGSRMIVWGGGINLSTGGRYDPATDTWAATTTQGAPEGRRFHVAAWATTAQRMVVWGGCVDSQCSSHRDTGGRYDPVADAWTPTTTANAPTARSQATAVWTGTEVIVWGGCTSGECQIELNTGGRYDPVADTWAATGLPSDPGHRINHTAVWTGAEMIVWGGFDQSQGLVLTGRRYDPATDTWSGIAFTGLVGARDGHTAIWTGTEMVVWGGREAGLGTTITGGRYRPATDTWQPTNTNGAPDPRAFHTAVWTGSKMVVWGGCAFDDCASYRNTGGRYDPSTDTWAPTTTVGAPTARFLHTGVWTGDRMVVWGGHDGVSNLGTGGRYEPVGDAWSPTSLAAAPAPRRVHTAVWTGAEMIVWGGRDDSAALNTGGRYQPVADTWTPTSATGAPAARWDHVAVWTTDEMVVWGGCTNLGCDAFDKTGLTTTGGRYDPVAGTWVPTSTIFAPHGRTGHTAVWTGQDMIVWGGWRGSSAEITNTGARYCAAGGVIPQPDIAVTPNPLAFGAVVAGQSTERTLTVLNAGNGALTVASVLPPAPPFSIVANACTGTTLPPGGSCTIRVRFAPLAAGPSSGQLIIFSNDPDEPEVTVALQGTGVTVSLQPAALALQDANGNGVWDLGETTAVTTTWANTGSIDAPAITGIATASAGITLIDGTAAYGTIPAGATRSCVQGGDCYDATAIGPRPATHWDSVLSETLSSGHPHDWTLHVGGSFSDAGPGHPFYRFVETVLHNGVTGGCTATGYCPEQITTREQMAVFVLVANEGPAFTPPPCQPGAEVFGDVPASSPFCRWIEELARRGVVAGCGAGNYCPSGPVAREQMSVFLLRTLDPALSPPACTTPMFGDVPPSSPFCRWIEEAARRAITGGCSTNPPLYCPAASVTRGQMAVFCTTTFGLVLYGP